MAALRQIRVLYHAFRPAGTEPSLPFFHEIDDATFAAQLSALRRLADSLAGRAEVRVEIDDGYRSVFAIGVPLTIAAGLPVTVNLSGAMLAGEGLWRDFVRCLVREGLVTEFRRHWRETTGQTLPEEPRGFYRATKSPRSYSPLLRQEIISFLETKSPGSTAFCRGLAADPADLVDHPLVTYGNHGYGHHVMAALTRSEQRDDIARNAALMDGWLAGMTRSRCSAIFALPFGRDGDANSDTFAVLRELDFRGLSYSRGRVDLGRPGRPFLVTDRWMAPPELTSFTRALPHLRRRTAMRIAKGLLAKLRGSLAFRAKARWT